MKKKLLVSLIAIFTVIISINNIASAAVIDTDEALVLRPDRAGLTDVASIYIDNGQRIGYYVEAKYCDRVYWWNWSLKDSLGNTIDSGSGTGAGIGANSVTGVPAGLYKLTITANTINEGDNYFQPCKIQGIISSQTY
jgi:hypothetical protein